MPSTSRLPRRRTDRRYYSSWDVPVADIALMAARAARNGVTLCQVEDLDTLNRIVAESVREHLNREDLAELTSWSGRYASVASVPARSTPASDPTATIPGRIFAGPVLSMVPESSSADDHAVVLALGTRVDDRLAGLRAGEATSAVLLTATSMGLASCPVTEPLEVAATSEEVRSDIFGDSNYPPDAASDRLGTDQRGPVAGDTATQPHRFRRPGKRRSGRAWVSPEGACAAYYNFGRIHRDALKLAESGQA